MYQLLALLAGAAISVMVAVNGDLTAGMGVFRAAAVIHVVGVVFSYFLCRLKKVQLFKKAPVPLWAYLGGATGVLTTLFNNYDYAHLSMTSIVALGLLGQCVTSNFLDAFGLLGMDRRPVRRSTWVGILLSCAGVGVMLGGVSGGNFGAMLLALVTGGTVVVSRVINARLSRGTGALAGSFYNHLVGLPFCAVLAAAIPAAGDAGVGSLRPWMFSGGIFGVALVVLFNVTVPKLSAFRVTLLSFIGQIFAGAAIDLALGRTASPALFWGGLLSALGLLAGMLLEWLESRREQQKEKAAAPDGAAPK